MAFMVNPFGMNSLRNAKDLHIWFIERNERNKNRIRRKQRAHQNECSD